MVFSLSLQVSPQTQLTAQHLCRRRLLLLPPPLASVHPRADSAAPAMFEYACGERESVVCPGPQPYFQVLVEWGKKVEQKLYFSWPPSLSDAPLLFPSLISAHWGSPRPQRSSCLGLGAWGFSVPLRAVGDRHLNLQVAKNADTPGGKGLPTDLPAFLALTGRLTSFYFVASYNNGTPNNLQHVNLWDTQG